MDKGVAIMKRARFETDILMPILFELSEEDRLEPEIEEALLEAIRISKQGRDIGVIGSSMLSSVALALTAKVYMKAFPLAEAMATKK